ncbi:MAG TPA: PVC-type heme-binding CxxCH protein [Caulifigura sp.]|nr:PVC-type heme-binding CxxCH protein [Caulifigura sp.]
MRALLLCLAVWMSCGSLSAAEPPALKILFLGDNGHHRPADRFHDLAPALEKRNIDLKYSDDAAVALTAETLNQFDGLVIYANTDAITPAQEQALLDYVASGKGFIPLHCASFCFRNSPKYIELVGAQFQKHGGEVFSVENAVPDHPIMKGYGGFESWDETYIHTKHNEKDRTVLEYRVQGGQAEGKSKEPWTWIRTHGKGRVFYTAWGHDRRTFGNPGFQNLVERGLRWACGQDPAVVPTYAPPASKQFTPLSMTAIAADAPKFEYIDVGPKIPNYRNTARWGEQGSPHTQMQLPLPPDASMQHYSVPVGFHLELFAAEPDFAGKPIAMNWDERGRLWVCETVDYPNELQPAGGGRDRIRILEDTNGDGRADRFTVFAEDLSIPTALAFSRGGVIVQNGPETLFLKDTNGDDKADLREVLIRGWAISDTHGGVSNFQYGLDNWIWAMQGYNNSRPEYGDGKKSDTFRQGFFRFQMADSDAAKAPAVRDVEFIRSSNNNTWGFGMSEEGLIFGSTANRNPSMFMPIANRYYERVRGWSSEQLGSIADTYLFKAITDKVRQVDQFGGYTAGAGHALYTARNYPQAFWNQTAFVCEPTGHLVGTFALTRDGAGYRSTSPMNLAAADDEWAAPIMAEVGPDGNVWILDWYNYIVQHNPTPAGFKTGKGNAYESDLRDKKHGRVYRLVYDGAAPSKAANSEPLSIDQAAKLVVALTRENLLWRRHAQRLLVERGQTDVVPALLALVRDPAADPIGLNVGAIHALWTLHGLGVIDDSHPDVMKAVVEALGHPSAGVRRNAVQVLPITVTSTDALVAAGVTGDDDAQVRLAAILALSDLPPTPKGGQRVAQLAVDSSNVMNDRWLADAVTSAAAMQSFAFLEQLKGLSSSSKLPPANAPVWSVAARVGEHIARGRPTAAEVEKLLAILDGAPGPLSEDLLAGLSRGWPKDHAITLGKEAEPRLVAVFQSLSAGSKGQLIRLASSWGSRALDRFGDEIVAALTSTASNPETSNTARRDALQQLVSFRSTSDETVAKVLELVTPKTPSDFASDVIATLESSQAPGLGTQLVERLPSLSPAARNAAIRVLLGRPATTITFLDAAEAGTLQLSDLSLDQKQALSAHPDPRIRQRALKLLKQTGGLPNPDREKVIAELLHDVERQGDSAAGKEVFKKQCSKCHMHSGEGQRIGPDLTGMAVHPKHELLIHILDPSRSVEGNFRVYTVAMSDGRVLSGMLAGESKTAIEIVDTEAKRHAIPREDIDELIGSRKSLMPEGFEKQLKTDELRDLLEFLTSRGRYFPLDLAKVASVVSTKGMFHSEASDVERLVFSDWTPKTFDGVPFYLVDPDGDRRPNAVLLYGPNGVTPPRMPKTVSLTCRSPAKAIHLLSGVGGWAWPLGQKGSVSMIVRLHYADGSTEDHELKNGVHFADYIRPIDVPESKLAFRLRGQQLRYLSIEPRKKDVIETVELLKGMDATSPVVMAVTVETQ